MPADSLYQNRPDLQRAVARVDAMLELLQQREAQAANDGVLLVNGADLQPQPIRWLWKYWLARGKFHILAGPPSDGKTTIALNFAATITQGGQWPDGSRFAGAGNILVWSSEDDPADTLLPRLLASGAERSRCYFVKGTVTEGVERAFDPARDLPSLEHEALRIGDVCMLIVDPVVAAVAGDSHKNTEVRRGLQPLLNLGARLDAAVLGISHVSKGSGGGMTPLSRVTGSIAFGAVPRIVLQTGMRKGADDGSGSATTTAPSQRTVVRSKSNIGPDGGGFEYQIGQLEVLPGIETNQLTWGQAVQGTANDLLAPEPASPPGEPEASKSAVAKAEEFLREALALGMLPSTTVEAEAKEAGLSWAAVKRASTLIGVIKTRSGSGAWFWKMARLHD